MVPKHRRRRQSRTRGGEVREGRTLDWIIGAALRYPDPCRHGAYSISSAVERRHVYGRLTLDP
jgi:hypothetical protein